MRSDQYLALQERKTFALRTDTNLRPQIRSTSFDPYRHTKPGAIRAASLELEGVPQSAVAEEEEEPVMPGFLPRNQEVGRT